MQGFFTRGGTREGAGDEEAMLRERFGLVLVPGGLPGRPRGERGVGGCCHTGKAVPGSQITLSGYVGFYTLVINLTQENKIIHRYSETPHSTQTHCFLSVSFGELHTWGNGTTLSAPQTPPGTEQGVPQVPGACTVVL